jgi:hypothetical protein
VRLNVRHGKYVVELAKLKNEQEKMFDIYVDSNPSLGKDHDSAYIGKWLKDQVAQEIDALVKANLVQLIDQAFQSAKFDKAAYDQLIVEKIL